jgi:hypothetical protein
MILTAGILVIGFGLLFLAGIPLTLLLYKERDGYGDSFWAIVPFAGYALIAIVLKAFVGFGLTVRQLAIPMLVILIVLFTVVVIRKKRLPQFPVWIGLSALAVLLINGLGYFYIGAESYGGYFSADMFFYGSQPQFHMDYPISTSYSDIPYQPGYSYGILSPYHRVSRSMLQAFIAVLCGTEAKNTLGFISLLGPVLTFFALCFATKYIKLNGKWRIAACLFGASVPGVALVHLDGFIGASLATPYIVLWIPLLYELIEKPRIRSALLVSAIFATAITNYSEVTLVYILLCIFTLTLVFINKKVTWRGAVYTIGALILGFLVNIQAMSDILMLAVPSSVNIKNSLDSIYPFGLSLKGMVFMFFGTIPLPVPNLISMIIRFTAGLLFFFGFFGLAYHSIKRYHTVVFTFLAMCFAPLIFLSGNREYLYDYFKLSLMMLPLLVVGIWYLSSEIYSKLRTEWAANDPTWFGNLKKAITFLLLGAVTLTFTVSGTFSGAATIRLDNKINASSDKYHIYVPSSQAILKQLKSTRNENMLFVASKSSMVQWWMAYEARHDKIWYLSPYTNEYYAFQNINSPNEDLSTVPMDVRIVWDPTYYCIIRPDAQKETVAAMFCSMNYKTGNNYLPTSFPNKNYKDNTYELRIFSKEDKNATLKLFVGKDKNDGKIIINVGELGRFPVPENGVIEVPMNLKKGGTVISIRTSSQDENADNPNALIYVRDCQLLIN